ncbi:BZ3500_MvSof-1268-A1-R1_Chr3-1g05986 [Microbotryum saponariae]|uniref:BZ3500_MvSof-1268-A1-R1_Chr3-1g05986 protein n=1 Tax=Microbotryum saponariae TaxID=289078 RepID=A0A2X0NHR9_9BASI|nr:BZ3500_MvSof-1268-A1-R1_Chr3-1g05986 [Microbotryum saponariae]SDA05176.1 BZ3501_MvSof-1269-A2-R1_Chr3-1g05656 [Microbotryum saponariae]
MRTTTPTNKPLRAKVDLSQFTSPPVSKAGVNTPSPRVRTHNIREGDVGIAGAPSSATATTTTTTTTTTMAKRAAAAAHANSSTSRQHSPLIRAQSSTSSLSSTRANPTWSANFAASTSTRSASPTRPPHSPPQRYGTPTMTTVASDLKGQNDAFPKTIDYLPLSVSVRKVHSPPLRSSPHLTGGHGPLASSSSTSYFPPGLSTSPGSTSTTSSPLTSPSISSLSADSHVNVHAANSVDGGPRRVKSAFSSEVQRGPGAANPSTPVSVLLPAFSGGSSTTNPVPLSRTTGGMRARSPPRDASHTTPVLRTSPTRPVLSPRPASVTSTASSRHARSHSATSATSSIFSSTGSNTIALASPYASNPLHVVASTSSWGRQDSTASTGTRSSGRSDQGLMGIDWSRPQHFDEEEGEQRDSDLESSFDDGVHEDQEGVSKSNMRKKALADQTIMLPSPSFASGFAPRRPELVMQSSIDEMSEEKEARIQRKILDLEITNKSLLGINASLEQLKIKHTAELRDLRRRMRESNAGIALAPFRTPLSPRKTKAVSTNGSISPLEGMSSDEDDDEGEEEDEDDEAAWERILEKDPHYAAVCQTIEALLRKGKMAIESKVEEKDLGGIVLHALEIQQEADSSDDLVRWVDAEVQTDGHGRTTSTNSGASGRKLVNGWQR